MPTRAPRACGYPGCGGITGHCPEHDALRAAAKQRQRPGRPNRHARGYTNDWARLVARAKQEQRRVYGHVFCVDCGITELQCKDTDEVLTGDHLRWPALTVDDVEIVCRRDNSRRGARRANITAHRT